jgi:hypothetical protein
MKQVLMAGMEDETSGTEYPPVSVECTITARASAAENYHRNAPPGWRSVPPGPIAEFVAAVIEGLGERGVRAMRAIAEDEQYGPIHLVRLVCAAKLAARTFGSAGLLDGKMHGARIGQLITGDVSRKDFPTWWQCCGVRDCTPQLT